MDPNPTQRVVTFEELSGSDHTKLFLVDCHLVNPPDLKHSLADQIRLEGEMRIMFPPQGIRRNKFKLCMYKVGGFSQILVVWPFTWDAPAPNRLGWLPKLEFGNPNFPPYYTDINPALTGEIAPFTYTNHKGETCNPPPVEP